MNDPYYQVLEFLDTKQQANEIDADVLKSFKASIRDNKYVSTFIRALKNDLEGISNFDDFIRKMDKMQNNKKTWDDVVPYHVREALQSTFSVTQGIDPVKTLHYVIDNAIEREGKICDFRDSVNPDTKIGSCQNDEHLEIIDYQPIIPLTEDEQIVFDRIAKEESIDAACDKFIEKFNPDNQELELALGQDIDTNKFDDSDTYYICKKCMDSVKENNDCEVSCDLG